MPEGDTIHRAAATLHAALAGRVVTEFVSRLAQPASVHADTPLTGRTVTGARAMGKHLLIEFSGDLVLRTHMRMSGSWHLYRPGEPWQRSRAGLRLLIGTDAFVAVAFDVPVAELVPARRLAGHPALAALGPDLLSVHFDEAEALRRLEDRAAVEIADALLDQRVVAGIGNVFKSEILFVAGVSPFARVATLTPAERSRVLGTARRLLATNTVPASARRSVDHGLRQTTGRANPAQRHWVYRRAGRPCRRCGTAIRARKQGPDARTTYWCPACQAPPAG